MEETILEKLTAYATRIYELAIDNLGDPAILYQIAIIAALFVPALLLSFKVEPLLEARARTIKGMPALLRFVVAFLRRLEWLFFALFLGLAYIVTNIVEWPGRNFLVYSCMLLSGAWLLVTVVSQAIRSRFIGRFFAWIAWIYVAASIFGVTDDVVSFLERTTFGFGPDVNLLFVLNGIFLFGVLLWLSYIIGGFVEGRINKIDELTPSLRVLIGKIVRISLIILAVMVGLSTLNIDLTALTVLSGAVGVGLGFGLQKVVSNFISGIIILMDQSIKPGDTITLGETFGWVRELRARFVSVVTRDGREYLIPNEDFITREVVNWSFSDRYVRLDVAFGVSYESDPHQVTELVIEAAKTVARVNASGKEPVCWLTEFGDSSINFLLRFWIDDPQKGLTNVRGKVLLAVWDTFKEHGINIPFPHREVIMRTPVELKRTE
ncbi:MAG TPA: mechanosensitive ion channel [Woeseiaceae bacterium]|nr:mechanosensitive ion channel [Woeseiaceae bacterium]